MILRYTETGFLVILPEDNPHQIVDAMLDTGYSEEFCVSPDFSPEFIARLMDAGFLVMSSRMGDPEDGKDDESDTGSYPPFILLPRLHLSRSALFYHNLHIKKSIKRHLGSYELCFDTDFDRIVNRCLEIHGDDWLTPPLVSAIRHIRHNKHYGVYSASFALYRDGVLVAGEFGVIAGRVYTSYSGYYDESNSGTVQLILTARYLQENDYAFFDLGMPLTYKNDIGAENISPEHFVSIFRAARDTMTSAAVTRSSLKEFLI
jgi:Leu/Phe-tRNA-protein transferase